MNDVCHRQQSTIFICFRPEVVQTMDYAETCYTIPSQQYFSDEHLFELYSEIPSNIDKPTANQALALLAS